MDGSCRVIFFERGYKKFWSCHLGDGEFIERESNPRDERLFRTFVNFKGKFYGLTCKDWNLLESDFVDLDLQYELVISGESIEDVVFSGFDVYLVESCEDLLLVSMATYGYEASDVRIFKADFSIGEWVKVETLGDRVIFLDRNNSFSYRAAAVGMKGNAIYWVRTPFPWRIPLRHLYMYDIEDKSISTPFSVFGIYKSLCWVSFPMEQSYMDSLFEASPNETSFHLKKEEATIKSMELQIEKGEETETIVKKESFWADLHNDLLLEIFPHLFAGDKVVFGCVCKSWYCSLSTPLSKTTQQFVLPLKSSGCSVPLLMCPDNKLYNPIHGELYSMNFTDIGAKVRAARGGWFLMNYYSAGLLFFSPFSKKVIYLPEYDDAMFYYSVYFSSPPKTWDCCSSICFMKSGDEDWTCREIQLENESFRFSFCNPVVYEGMYYFLGYDAKLLIFDPKRDEVRVIETPKFISDLEGDWGGEQYMLEGDGKLMAVFVGSNGSSVYTCEWNVCTSKWEIVESLENKMLFVSRPLSICIRATVRGTGNKIYFPRVVGNGHILFYSLGTKRYHTFEMGTSYPNFLASKYYSEYNGWFMP
ncbi:hypothetical protein OROMI_032765 [Orobanche minor]